LAKRKQIEKNESDTKTTRKQKQVISRLGGFVFLCLNI